MNDSSTHARHAVSKGRLEMLVDGIFAIAMTLLVLELKVPELEARHSAHDLLYALLRDFPIFGSYLLTFLMLGTLWYRHNGYYRHYQFISRGMLALQLVQMSAAAFFPFTAALLGRYPGNPLSFAVYVATIMVYLWSSLFGWMLAKRVGALDPALPPEQYVRHRNRQIKGSVIFLVIVVVYVIVLAS